MKITPYLNFAGDCRAAMTFYQSVFGGELEMTAHKDTPMAEHVPPEMQDQIMHAVLTTGDGVLFASDAPMAQANSFSGVYITVHPQTVEEAERMFDRLSEGGTVEMALEETFWAKRFGMLHDRWGVKWMFNVT
ncbi:VOC family protein [Pelagibacterium lacus]|uniref:VOC family protein n=1 Tax=Pelagibacterium lacus TaxID=2282655 RepID=A0A369W779_9HYPH|nr:VOC family protein [Pelagibacterium lacus]RDE10438.1 VOC family protein [Pelagibacterium lacus]